MLKKQTLKETVEYSPFKFLKAYQKDEADLFFGRKIESENLISAFKKSAFVILYGPSGSGKSSLINCGLIKGINAQKVFEIRRDQHILEAIQRKLFNNFSDLPENYFVKTTQDFYKVKSNIVKHQREIERIKKVILITNANYQRGKIDQQQLTEKVNECKAERKDLQVSLDAYLTLETQLEKDFIELMNKLLRHLKSSPYLIFDQFEEIFIFGSHAEIEAFGAFLAGLLDNNIPFKILLTVREEYFSRLGIFEKYLPQILYRNSFIDNPDKQTVARIIRKSFHQFNINQYYHGKDWSNLDPIPDKEQEDRINLIIDQLTPVNEQNENSVDLVDRNKRYHLPFLQIYLDKLYRKDFRKTYPIKPLGTLPPEFNGHLPLEFNLEEIKNFGNIDVVLKKYLHQVNQELIFSSQANNFLGEKGQNIIVKFLKFFTTDDNTKKRIKIDSKIVEVPNNQPTNFSETILFLENKQLSNQIQMSLWGEINESFYLPEISRFLIELDNTYRLLKISQEYVELSHDVLAKIINQYHIDSDLREIYKDQFEYSYRVYAKMGTIEETHLSSRQVIQYEDEKNAKTLEYILSDPKKSRALKKKIYWQDSKAIVQRRREKEIRKRNAIIMLFFALLIGMSIFAQRNYQTKQELTQSKGQNNQMNKESNQAGAIYKGTGDAFKNMNKNRTTAYRSILNSEENLSTYQQFIDGLRKLPFFKNFTEKKFFIGDIKNEFYKDFNQYPVYSKNFNFQDILKTNKVKTTKTFLSESNDSITHIFLQTSKDKLYTTSTNFKNANSSFSEMELVSDSISHFLPYHDDKDRLCLLLIKNDSLYKKFPNSNELVLIKGKNKAYKGAVNITQIANNQFITNNKEGILEFTFKDSINISWKNTKKGKDIKKQLNLNIRDLQAYGNNQYLAIYEKQSFITDFGSKNLNSIGQGLSENNVLLSTNRKKYYIGNEKKIQIRSSVYKTDDFTHNHEDAINSIDYHYTSPKEDLLLLGSQDRSASIWKNKNRIRTLIGHTDEILHASFIDDKDPNYVLTISTDGTLKIWDMRPIERRTEQITRADKITKLKFNKRDALLYIGFNFTDTDNPDGFLYSVCENLNLEDECCTRKVIQKISNNENLGHLTVFDFDKNNSPILGTKWTGLIASSTKTSSPIHLSGNDKIIDLAARDSLLAIARPNGLRFYPNYETSRSKGYKDRRDTLQDILFNAVAIHPKLPIIAGAAADNRLYLWNVASNEITSFLHHSDQVMDAAFSETGKYLISGSKDNKSIIWEEDGAGKYTMRSIFANHTSDIEDVAFYKDELFLTASRDHTVQIYELKNDEFVQYPSLIRHDTKITAATFSLDGEYIYSGDDDGVLKKWKFVDFETDIKARIPKENQ